MSADFEFNSLDEFKNQLASVANQFPGTCEKYLRRAGNKMKKLLVERSPDSGTDHKGKLKKSWKARVNGLKGDELTMDIWSTSPHFHLVDRGHVKKTKSGKVQGFVQGKHYLKKTADEIEQDVVPQEVEKLYKDIAKKLGG